jgi:hypothetical protein
MELPLRGATFPVCIFGSGGHSVAGSLSSTPTRSVCLSAGHPPTENGRRDLVADTPDSPCPRLAARACGNEERFFLPTLQFANLRLSFNHI